MRLCDLDDIKMRVERQYENCHGYYGNKKAIYREAILAVRSILHSAKTIDAVPVVRCKDCKFRKPTFNVKYYFCTVWDADDSETAYVTDNDFCSYGERKEGAE